jgi:hypothetical protein
MGKATPHPGDRQPCGYEPTHQRGAIACPCYQSLRNRVGYFGGTGKILGLGFWSFFFVFGCLFCVSVVLFNKNQMISTCFGISAEQASHAVSAFGMLSQLRLYRRGRTVIQFSLGSGENRFEFDSTKLKDHRQRPRKLGNLIRSPTYQESRCQHRYDTYRTGRYLASLAKIPNSSMY